MSRYATFDRTLFGHKKSDTVKASVSKKCEDGKTRSETLPEGVTCGESTAAFAAAAATHGVKIAVKYKDDGVPHNRSDTLYGEDARTATLELGDSYVPPPDPDADPVPPAVRKRGRNVAPSSNGEPAADGAKSE